ncbi:Prefoldin subunit-domain-containing protein [Neurospora tetraspora]|uniref:Prefoldin subunit-domain-containing protein n=1 Tax=Neurospora tetraspora TaxID=94610 RepID=A0AAE0JMZ7_9PEZI|nr:Prefoldin subunit-domain-containing protein [Neurospora tetraspora]
MAASRDHLADLDRHMQLLEGKVNQLHASLTHWQQTYFEYAALKEEVDSLPKDPPPRTELARIRRDYDGTLITKKEIGEIFGENDLKEADQISSVLGRRLDYVEKNVDTLTKLVETEENKLAAAKVIANPDGGTDEETGLPITDIIEELDDEDNVLQYRLQSGGEVGKRVEEALKKAGIEKLPETQADLSQAQAKSNTTQTAVSASAASATASESSSTAPTTPSTSSAKSVTFADDTKSVDQLPTTADELRQLMQKVKEQEAMDMSKAVIPEDEPEDESQLRADMLQYMQKEIHPIVAELEIDEGSTEDENAEWDEYEDELEEDDDDDEDEFGRSKHSVITSDYIQRMQELEKRLGFKSAFTVERQKPQQPDDENRKDAGGGYITVVREPRSTPASVPAPAPAPESTQLEPTASSLKSKGKAKEKKGVRFATDLDIAPEEEIQPAVQPKPAAPKVPLVNPIGDIVEHGAVASEPTAQEQEPEEPEPPKRVSRFKKERASTGKAAAPAAASPPPGPFQLPQRFRESHSAPPAEPTPPEDQILANQVVERSVSSAPQEPDDMDDELLYRAAAVEYNRLRNRMIQKEGGFMKPEEEQPVVPLDEEEGGPPRMSRFKAARLARS